MERYMLFKPYNNLRNNIEWGESAISDSLQTCIEAVKGTDYRIFKVNVLEEYEPEPIKWNRKGVA